MAEAEVFDPKTGSFSPPGVERQFPAVALAGGLVLVTGGYSEQTQPTDSFALVTV